MEEVSITKLVHGGQGMGTLADGRKVFVWNALPGERVQVRLTKKRRDYAEGIAEEILEPSQERVKPLDEAYLSTSPWQIFSFEAENRYKKDILEEALRRESVEVEVAGFQAVGEPLHYRNKMEYSFWADDQGLHLALFHRASHGKRIVTGSSIARPEIDEVAGRAVAILNKHGVRGSQLKTIILRVNKKGEVVCGLFVKDEGFPKLEELRDLCKGTSVYFSNPKSPASIITRELYGFGDVTLTDDILGRSITYDVNSFFQVNLPVFEAALEAMKAAVKGASEIIDMYAGVGTIGLTIGAQKLVELDTANISMAQQNAGNAVEVVQASTENALEYITSTATMIFDPPRAGLHEKVTTRLLDAKPPKIVYLSCNPATQARDLAKLQKSYKITSLIGYNFFPRTPHIESLGILERR